MKDDLTDTLDGQGIAQVRQEHRLISNALDPARLARRHLADDRYEHRRTLASDRRHLHGHVEILERDMTVAFAERTLWLQKFGIDKAFDHDFGAGRHFEVDRDSLGRADRI